MPTEKTVTKIIHERLGALPQLQQKMQLLQQLNQLWQKHVDKALLNNSRVANLRNQCLIIEVTSPAWATRLRYLAPNLLMQLQQETLLANLQEIDWYVRTIQFNTFLQRKRVPFTLSQANAAILNEAAAEITHEKLKKALQHLAKNAKQ